MTMMNLEIINQELTSDEFVLKTQQQIAKDFGTAGIAFPDDFVSVARVISHLNCEVSSRLRELNTTSSSTFSQLLYQIDIPESILSDLSRSDDYFQRLAEIVIKREAYKVFLRRKFSS